MKQVVVRTVAFGSEEYAHTRELRERVLRRPLGLTLSAEDTAGEEGQLHIAALADGQVIGCLIASFSSVEDESEAPSARLRQIAVEPEWQRSGIGTRLMEFVEQELAARGVVSVRLHARADATHFYTRLGFSPEGAAFNELGILHQKMVRRLKQPGDLPDTSDC